jgi:hypothetical protein
MTASFLVFGGCDSFRKTVALPPRIYWEEGGFHVQGVAVDTKRGYVYFSFTTKLVKTDLDGRLIGSVEGMTGHLGCIDINPADGRVYGSLEYKNDGIGKGILTQLEKDTDAPETGNPANAFYIAVFDAGKITRPGMNAETDNVLTTVYLKEVADDYNATVTHNGQTVEHRYGCSGIDGLAFGPSFGESNGKYYLHVAYGIYGDTTRTDNDYQVILQYDVNDRQKYEQPLSQNNMHQSGPETPLNKYFVFTGNTTYGIQNLAYDANTGYWFAAVYRGKKSQYPNYPLFTIDGSQQPDMQPLKGFDNGEKGKIPSLAKAGIYDTESDIYGWEHKWGSTGIHSFGNGYFYISQNGVTPDKKQYCRLQLYRWTGQTPDPFEEVNQTPQDMKLP